MITIKTYKKAYKTIKKYEKQQLNILNILGVIPSGCTCSNKFTIIKMKDNKICKGCKFRK